MRRIPWLVVPALCLLAPIAFCADTQTVTLRDGRVLTGIYDQDAGTITISGAGKAVIRIAKEDVLSIVVAASVDPAPTAAADAAKRHDMDPLAALDQQIAQKTQDRADADASVKDFTTNQREETEAAARAVGTDSQKVHTDRATTFGKSAAKWQLISTHLTSDIQDLKVKRQDLLKKRGITQDTAQKSADGLAAYIDGLKKDADSQDASPTEHYHRLDSESKAIQDGISQLTAQLKSRTDELTRLKAQVERDVTFLKGLDLTDVAFKAIAGEADAAKETRLADLKAYNLTMATLRNALADYAAGTKPDYETAYTALHQDGARKLQLSKTGKPLVFPDDPAK
jgi:chromosome segregation ATPase